MQLKLSGGDFLVRRDGVGVFAAKPEEIGHSNNNYSCS
jgi:hypothetical protein